MINFYVVVTNSNAVSMATYVVKICGLFIFV